MFSKKILQFFPPPKFLDSPYAGLAMSDAHIRLIQFESSAIHGLKVKKYVELPLPAGAITSGRVNNKEQIVAVLAELKKQTGIEYVRVSIPEEKAYLFEIKLPVVSPKEVKSAIEFKLEENVPLPADNIIFDYTVVKKDHEQITAVVSALPSKFVDIYLDLFNSSGFVPYVFEIESQAIVRALLVPGDANTCLIVHFAKGKIGLCIVSDGVVHFTSTLTTMENWQDNPSFITAEIRKVIAYWQTNRGEDSENNTVKKIYISGDILGDSIISQLSSSLKVEVVFGNVWINAFDINTVVPEIPFSVSLQYTAAIGLALPSDSLI